MYKRSNGVKHHATSEKEKQAFIDLINKQVVPKSGYICLNVIVDDVQRTMEAVLKSNDGSRVIKCEIQGEFPAVKLIYKDLQLGDMGFFEKNKGQYVEPVKEVVKEAKPVVKEVAVQPTIVEDSESEVVEEETSEKKSVKKTLKPRKKIKKK